MKQKKLLALLGSICLILVLAALPFMGACAPEAPPEEVTPPPEEEEVPPPEAAPEYTFRFSHEQSKGHASYDLCAVARDLLAVRSEGRVKMELYGGKALGGATASVDMCSANELEMAALSLPVLTKYVPWLSLGDYHFAFSSAASALNRYRGVIIPEANKALASANLRIVSINPGGFKIFMGNKAILSAEDLEGVKFRCQAPGIGLNSKEAWGCKPIATPWPEVFPSMEQGIIDMIELSVSLGLGTHIHDVAKHWSVSNHIFYIAAYVCSAEWWDTLPSDVQELMTECWTIAGNQNGMRALTEAETGLLKVQEEFGVEVVYLPPEEIEKLKALLDPVKEWAISEYGKEKVDLFHE